MITGWAIMDHKGRIRPWTFRNLRKDAISAFMQFARGDWRTQRKAGVRAVRVVIMEERVAMRNSAEAHNWRVHVERVKESRKRAVAPRPFFEPGAQG